MKGGTITWNARASFQLERKAERCATSPAPLSYENSTVPPGTEGKERPTERSRSVPLPLLGGYGGKFARLNLDAARLSLQRLDAEAAAC